MISQELIQDQFRTHLRLPDLQIRLSVDWGANTPDYRQSLRQSLCSFSGEQACLDLRRRPELPNQNVSISHCPATGGFALIAKPIAIGLDIEMTDRIRIPTVERIASPEELHEAPEILSLWPAKEATWKALQGSNQPKVISELRISNWCQISTQFLVFRASRNDFKHKLNGLGGVWLGESLRICVFILSPLN